MPALSTALIVSLWSGTLAERRALGDQHLQKSRVARIDGKGQDSPVPMADRSYLTGLIQRGVPFVVSLLVFVLVVQLLGALEWNGTALRVLALIVAAAAAFVAWAITSTAIK